MTHKGVYLIKVEDFVAEWKSQQKNGCRCSILANVVPLRRREVSIRSMVPSVFRNPDNKQFASTTPSRVSTLKFRDFAPTCLRCHESPRRVKLISFSLDCEFFSPSVHLPFSPTAYLTALRPFGHLECFHRLSPSTSSSTTVESSFSSLSHAGNF